MSSIAKCTSLREFADLVYTIEGPTIGKSGGRKFLVKDKQETMNALIHKYLSLTKETKLDEKNVKENVEMAKLILDRLTRLNRDVTHMKDLTPKQRKALNSRQFLGSLGAKFKCGFNFSRKNLELKTLENLYKPLLNNFAKDLKPIANLYKSTQGKSIQDLTDKQRNNLDNANEILEKNFNLLDQVRLLERIIPKDNLDKKIDAWERDLKKFEEPLKEIDRLFRALHPELKKRVSSS